MRIGIDMMSGERIKAFHDRWGGRGLARLFSPEEINVLESPNGYERLAARFAAKEALIKALGRYVDFRKIETTGGGWTPPGIRWREEGRWRTAMISITHHEGLAAAVCLVED